MRRLPNHKKEKKNRTERCGNSTRKDGQREKQKRFRKKRGGGALKACITKKQKTACTTRHYYSILLYKLLYMLLYMLYGYWMLSARGRECVCVCVCVCVRERERERPHANVEKWLSPHISVPHIYCQYITNAVLIFYYTLLIFYYISSTQDATQITLLSRDTYFILFLYFISHAQACGSAGWCLTCYFSFFFRMRKRTFCARPSGERVRIRRERRSCVHITKPQPIPRTKPLCH